MYDSPMTRQTNATRLTQCTAFALCDGYVFLNAPTTLRAAGRPVWQFVNFQQNVKRAFYRRRRRRTRKTERNLIVYTIWLVHSTKIIRIKIYMYGCRFEESTVMYFSIGCA